MKHRVRALVRFIRQTRAVSALEYAILVGVIAVAIGAALATFGDDITNAIEKIGDAVEKVETKTPKAKP